MTLDHQLTFDEVPGLVGHDHPDTSHLAAQLSARANLNHRARLLLELRRRGRLGLTAGEAGRLLGVSTNIAGSRFVELRGDGSGREYPTLIERTDDTRAVPGGRACVVHVLTPLGVEVADLLARSRLV